jgi:hypothetical protein
LISNGMTFSQLDFLLFQTMDARRGAAEDARM